MGNPNNDSQFNWDFSIENNHNNLDTLFEHAVTDLSSKAWFKRMIPDEFISDLPYQSLFNVASEGNWSKLLPFPKSRPQPSMVGRFSQIEANWIIDEKNWATKATTWLKEICIQINYKIYQIKNHINKGVPLLNKEFNIDLVENNVLRNWFDSTEDLPLYQFLELKISSKTIGAFIAQEATKLRQEIIPDLPIIDVTEYQCGLSLRQVALLYAYRGKTILRDDRADNTAQLYGYTSGEKLYQHYVKVNTPTQRTGIEKSSINKMVEDISKILLFLEGLNLKQAETERYTLKLRKE